jgi:hypothetical protein
MSAVVDIFGDSDDEDLLDKSEDENDDLKKTSENIEVVENKDSKNLSKGKLPVRDEDQYDD